MKVLLVIVILLLLPFVLPIVIGLFKRPKKVSEDELMKIQEGAKNNDPESLFKLATMYDVGENGLPKDPVEAFTLYQKAANLGHAWAMNNLGEDYLHGIGVKSNYSQAFYWYHEAAKRDVDSACISLGMMYLNGFGTKKDLNLATWWYFKAEQLGSIRAGLIISGNDEMCWIRQKIRAGVWKPQEE